MRKNMEMVKNLEKLENEYSVTNWKIGDTSDQGMKEALKRDLELCEYCYKVATIELTMEDRDKLYNIAIENDIKLAHIKEFVFDEEEKEDYYELQSAYDEPAPAIPGWDDDLKKMKKTSKYLSGMKKK